jgi:hypothetical protein
MVMDEGQKVAVDFMKSESSLVMDEVANSRQHPTEAITSVVGAFCNAFITVIPFLCLFVSYYSAELYPSFLVVKACSWPVYNVEDVYSTSST